MKRTVPLLSFSFPRPLLARLCVCGAGWGGLPVHLDVVQVGLQADEHELLLGLFYVKLQGEVEVFRHSPTTALSPSPPAPG